MSDCERPQFDSKAQQWGVPDSNTPNCARPQFDSKTQRNMMVQLEYHYCARPQFDSKAQRATARMLGVSDTTVKRDINATNVATDEKNTTDYEDVTDDNVTNVAPPEIPGWMDEGGEPAKT